ncbi:MAG: hypothetical protein COU81_02145 [Candidatus Portnoybacteria bacterium CG10_big_fil_rev_8_21_14_0_10_36_7]|uniref:DUF5667 domain-containing protein n=1 Tax=Candidatus Portnoybacteria bacterium CG10_big_fil_rev_8_21_14_0_10_36_7 TaxID=1974812 RepID=A0A2M8KE40_9BACT|nr:MAG: hypothetical protein COU81_02145 [Candidatus Portnoybacteria bacterium CG10_big_fil_rev_8_21_14_0_10_36_7]
MEKILISQIKSLKKIQPSKEWLGSFRNELISGIKTESHVGFRGAMEWFFIEKKVAPVLFGVMLFVLGGPLIVSKIAQNSLHGDLLYPVKLATEQFKIKLAMDKADKASLEVEAFNQRVQELNLALINPNLIKTDEVSQAVIEAQKQLISVKTRLSGLDGSIVHSQKGLEVVKTITNNTADAQKTLASSLDGQNNLDPKIIEQINDIVASAEKTEVKGLEYLVKNTDKNDTQDITSKLGDKIDKASQDVKKVEDTVTGSVDKGSINAVLIQTTEAKKGLTEAKESLENGDLNTALDKIKVSQEITKSASVIVSTASSTAQIDKK